MPQDHQSEQFTKMVRRTLETPAWQSLSTAAQALYPHIKLEWKGPKANNNGKLTLSMRQAAQRIGISKTTACKAFQDLQAKGFIVVTKAGCPGLHGQASGHEYEVTEIALPHLKARPRMLFKDWKPDTDFPVVKSNANNPDGLNGIKTRS